MLCAPVTLGLIILILLYLGCSSNLRWGGRYLFYSTSCSLLVLFLCLSVSIFVLHTEVRYSLSQMGVYLSLVVALFVGV